MRTTLIGLVLGLAAAAGPALADAGGGATVTLTDGNDHYTTTSNDSLVLAKGGNDVITVQAAYYDRENEIVQIAVYGGPGNDKIIGRFGIDHELLYGGPGNDHIEVWGSVTHSGAALGAGGDDTLICNGGDEGCNLVGGSGDDTLINQGTSSAYMNGGPGRDTLIGGPGRDYFFFAAGDTVAGPNRDVIKNFQHGSGSSDFIYLSGMDANVNVPGDQAFTFVAAAKHPGIGEVSYYVSGQNVIVVGNNGAKTFEIELQNFHPPLAATDFYL
jgi:Ca2+-binding RTX toxin-like protein